MKRLGIGFALVTAVMGLSTVSYLLFRLAQGSPKKDLGFETVFLMIFTWPAQLAGIGLAFLLWLGLEKGGRGSLISVGLWMHMASVSLWIAFLLTVGSL